MESVNLFSTSIDRSAPKIELNNPIYEGPMYDYLDDHHNNQPQLGQVNNTVTASEEPVSNCTTNLYQSIPINIPTHYMDNDFVSYQPIEHRDINMASTTADAESSKEEEETYTVMHTPIVMSHTPTVEDLRTW